MVRSNHYRYTPPPQITSEDNGQLNSALKHCLSSPITTESPTKVLRGGTGESDVYYDTPVRDTTARRVTYRTTPIPGLASNLFGVEGQLIQPLCAPVIDLCSPPRLESSDKLCLSVRNDNTLDDGNAAKTDAALSIPRYNGDSSGHETAIACSEELNSSVGIDVAETFDFYSATLQELAVEDDADPVSLSRLDPPIPVFGGTNGKYFLADQILEVDDMPMYPESSPSGTLNVGTMYDISLKNMTPNQREFLHTNIAYSRLETGSGNETRVLYGNAGRMLSRTWACRGVKLCSGLHPDVKHKHYGGASAEQLLQQNAALSSQFAGAMPREVPKDFLFGPPKVRLDNQQRAYLHAQQIEARVIAGKFCTHMNTDGSSCSTLR